MRLFALDNTLGYNPGRAGLAFSLADKLAIVHKLDGLGIHYVEAGCPGAGGSARKFFTHARSECHLAHARLVALARLDAVQDALERDDEMLAVIEAAVPVVALSANCWHAGPDGFEQYCRRIGEGVRFLKDREFEVIFRAEDFFDCFAAHPAFALHTLEAAKAAGANVLCLRDSSGNALPHVMREICIEVRKRFEGTLGICAHDDSDLAVANTLEAVEQGFTHIEGSINAYGPRRGLANLCSIISNLEHKLGHTVIGPQSRGEMAAAARLVAEANGAALDRRGRVKVVREPSTEQVLPALVDRQLLARLTETARRELEDRIQLMESEGYDLRAADGTLELRVREAFHPEIQPFVAEHYELTSHSALYGGALSTATTTVRVGEGIRSETEDGDGAVNALERSLRQCLFTLYPEIANIRVTDFHLAVLDATQGTTARVRVSLTWADSGRKWVTAGVSGDLIEAIWLALVDGYRLPLMRLAETGRPMPTAADSSWAV
jgi:2-isopropylmalate synthase